MLYEDSPITRLALQKIVNFNDGQEYVGLGIFVLYVIGSIGKKLTFAPLNHGADAISISQCLAQKLGVTWKGATVSVITLKSVKTENSLKVSLIVESLDGYSHVTVDQAFTLTK